MTLIYIFLNLCHVYLKKVIHIWDGISEEMSFGWSIPLRQLLCVEE